MKNFFIKKATNNIHDKVPKKIESCYNTYKKSAKIRGYDFKLSKSQFYHVISSKCHYCNSEPREYSDGNIRNGVDRIDNNIGYSYENVISCCGTCNKMKGTLSYREFIDHLEKINAQQSLMNDIRNKFGAFSNEFKSFMFKHGRYASPNELLECVSSGLLEKSDVKYDFKIALFDFPKEYEIVKNQIRSSLGKSSVKKFTRELYNKQQIKEWNNLDRK